MSRRFPLVAFAVVVAVALVVGGLSLAGGPTALRVDGDELATRSEVDDQLAAIAKSGEFAAQLSGQQSAGISKDTELDAAATAVWMTVRTRAAVSERALERRGVEVPTGAVEAATAQLTQVTGFSGLPKKLQRETIRYFAAIIGLQETLANEPTAELTAAAKQACSSGRYVSHILVPTADAAHGLIAQLNAGASFASLAQASSTDTASAVNGGELGCLVSGQFVAEFQSAAEAARVGTLAGPVQSQFGHHLIMVRDQPMKPDFVRAAAAAVTKLLRRTPVEVDSHYGRWLGREARVCPLSGC